MNTFDTAKVCVSGVTESWYPCSQQMESDHSTEVNSINDGISRMKTEHEQAIQTLEANFTEKLIVEYDKYESLEARRNEMREEYERFEQHRLPYLSRRKDSDILVIFYTSSLLSSSTETIVYSMKPMHTLKIGGKAMS